MSDANKIYVFTVTCLGTRAFGGSVERDRVMAICATVERAREIVERNELDIRETTFDHVVIEHARLDCPYPELGASRDTEEWYEWRNGGYVRVENQTAYREALRAAYDEAEKQPRRTRQRTTEEAAVESRGSHG